MRSTLALAALLAGSLGGYGVAALAADEPSAAGDGFSPWVDAQGTISKPRDYRTDWVHLGSWFVRADEEASGPGVHDVYADPAAVKGFLASGEWPDGATLVKEIHAIEEGSMTTGHAQWAGETGVWFVMVRDREQRFPDNAAWGEGWGWALFTQESPEQSVAESWQGEGLSNCRGCHLPAEDTGWVFIEGYPTLRDAAR